MAQEYNNFWVKCVIIVLFGVLVHECKSRALIKGDVIVKSIFGSVQTSKFGNVRSKRAVVVRDKKMIWDFGVVPYVIDMTAGFDSNKIAYIKAAMRQWENFTCIRFVERYETEHAEFIQFTRQTPTGYGDVECNCCSDVGKIGGRQDIALGGCSHISDMAHELGHAIGFQHEHERPDPDEYIEIKEDDVDTLGEPYDHESIMHYGQAANSKYRHLEYWIRKNGFVQLRDKRLTLADISTMLPKK